MLHCIVVFYCYLISICLDTIVSMDNYNFCSMGGSCQEPSLSRESPQLHCNNFFYIVQYCNLTDLCVCN